MQNFTTKIVNMMKTEKLFQTQGGPIILSQARKCDLNNICIIVFVLFIFLIIVFVLLLSTSHIYFYVARKVEAGQLHYCNNNL
jgi:hypothetical protein